MNKISKKKNKESIGIMQTQYTSACLCLQKSWLVTYTPALGGSDSLPEASEAPNTDVSSLPTTTRKH